MIYVMEITGNVYVYNNGGICLNVYK